MPGGFHGSKRESRCVERHDNGEIAQRDVVKNVFCANAGISPASAWLAKTPLYGPHHVSVQHAKFSENYSTNNDEETTARKSCKNLMIHFHYSTDTIKRQRATCTSATVARAAGVPF